MVGCLSGLQKIPAVLLKGANVNYCSDCGASVSQKIPQGDNRLRFVCDSCGTVHYENPRIVTGCLPVHEGKALLCRRAIEPRRGYWTLPGGFLELGETIEEGALRETREEAGANVQIRSLYTLFNVLHVGQLSLFFLADLVSMDFYAGEESLEARLFAEHEMPWEELAFTTIERTLRYYFEDSRQGQYIQRVGDILVNESRIVENT